MTWILRVSDNEDETVSFDELERNADKDEDPIAEEVINKEEVFKDFDDDEEEEKEKRKEVTIQKEKRQKA